MWFWKLISVVVKDKLIRTEIEMKRRAGVDAKKWSGNLFRVGILIDGFCLLGLF